MGDNIIKGTASTPQSDGEILNRLLSHFFLVVPKLVFMPAACDCSPIHSLRRRFAFPPPKSVVDDSFGLAKELPEYEPVIEAITTLVELGFLDVSIETDHVTYAPKQTNMTKRNYNWHSFCSKFRIINATHFADILAKMCESIEAEIVDLEDPQERVDHPVKEYPTKVVYSLTKSGYEVAMVLTAHKDSEAVRAASVASARTARIALCAAFLIALGSIGGFGLRIFELYCPLASP